MKTKIIFILTVLIGINGYSQKWDTVYFSYEFQYEDSLFIMEFVALPNDPISLFEYGIWGADVDITVGNGASSHYDGKANTNAIVEQLGDNGGVTYAAGYCHDMTVVITTGFCPRVWSCMRRAFPIRIYTVCFGQVLKIARQLLGQDIQVAETALKS